MKHEKQPSYYAIIPSTVRYDERLKFAERLLYGEITALIGTDGYCFATNTYFANLYGVIPGTISRWISHLEKLGYIKVELIKNDKKEIVERRIYITDVSYRKILNNTYEQNNTYPYKQNCLYSMSKKAKDNNINIRIDRFFNYIIKKEGQMPDEFQSKEELVEFYLIIEKLEMNYNKEVLEIFKDENIQKIKTVIYCIKELFLRNEKNILNKATRKELMEVYDNCKTYEKAHKGTEKEIKSFFEYYYASCIRKLKAK